MKKLSPFTEQRKKFLKRGKEKKNKSGFFPQNQNKFFFPPSYQIQIFNPKN